jgi:hypothetical protein
LKLNATCRLLVYADDNTLLGEKKLHTLKKNTEALLVASKEGGLEVNTDTNKKNRLDLLSGCCLLEDPSP